jgi:hypothetical protein
MVPAITVEAETQYLLEFPLLIGVTLRNDTADTDYLDLPELGLLTPLDSLAADLKTLDGSSALRLGPSFEARDSNLFRTTLMAGESTRVLIDLAHFGQPLKPGLYELSLALFSRPGVFRSSAPVRIELIAPSAEERSEALRLRHLGLRGNAVDTGSWRPFLTSSWNSVSVSPALGEQAARQLALYLRLHRLTYGPAPLSQVPLDTFRPLRGPVLSSEAEALEYELLAARASKPQLDATRSGILQKWPGLKARLDRIDEGAGLLTTLRKGYGVERDPPLPAGRRPYT